MKTLKVKTTKLGEIYLDVFDILPSKLVFKAETYTLEKENNKLVLTFF